MGSRAQGLRLPRTTLPQYHSTTATPSQHPALHCLLSCPAYLLSSVRLILSVKSVRISLSRSQAHPSQRPSPRAKLRRSKATMPTAPCHTTAPGNLNANTVIRHVGLLCIRDKQFMMEKIPLQTVRPFFIEEVCTITVPPCANTISRYAIVGVILIWTDCPG